MYVLRYIVIICINLFFRSKKYQLEISQCIMYFTCTIHHYDGRSQTKNYVFLQLVSSLHTNRIQEKARDMKILSTDHPYSSLNFKPPRCGKHPTSASPRPTVRMHRMPSPMAGRLVVGSSTVFLLDLPVHLQPTVYICIMTEPSHRLRK